MQQLGDDARPTRLMRCAQPAPVIAVEKFVEKDVVLEMRIARELGVILQDGTLTVFSLQK